MSLLKPVPLVLLALFFTGSSIIFCSCRSIAKAYHDSSGGKEIVGDYQRKKKHSVRKASKPRVSKSVSSSTSTKKIKPKADTPPAEKKEQSKEQPLLPVDPIKEVPKNTPVDDEKILMEEIPPLDGAPKEGKKVPGVEDLIPLEGPIKIKGDHANRIIDAGGHDVDIAGNNGVVVISGGCGKLTVNGTGNQVQCDSVEDIEVVGNENTLILGSVGGGAIRGDSNVLSWGSGIDGLSPIVESFGSDNTMKRLE